MASGVEGAFPLSGAVDVMGGLEGVCGDQQTLSGRVKPRGVLSPGR